MSQRLPRITGKELVKALKKYGFVCKRIEGSHHIMQKTFKIIKLGLLSHILRKARISAEKI